MSRATKKKGFTLIELLVAIAIVSILATILFPVFARAREGGRRSSCLSNLRQVGLGLQQYTQDYDSRFPQAYYYNDGVASSSGYSQWSGLIQPYTKSFQIFVCSSSKGLPPTNFDGSSDSCKVDAAGVTASSQTSGVVDNQAPCSSYIANELVLPRMKLTKHAVDPDNSGQYASGLGMQTVSDAIVDLPAEVIMVGEMSSKLQNLAGDSVSGGTASKTHRPMSAIKEGSSTYYESEDGTASPIKAVSITEAENAIQNPGTSKPRLQYAELDRHLGGGNYVFVDGHAKWYRLVTTLNPQHFMWGKKAYSVRNSPTVVQSDGTTPVG